MRISLNRVVAMTIASIGLFALSLVAQTQVWVLFRQLQSQATTDSARDQLLQLGRSDPKARSYLATHLPPEIARDYRPQPNSDFGEQWPKIREQWANAIWLAGELKLVEAIPVLARQIDVRFTPELNLDENSPAGTALCRIGDPAVPSVRRILDDGDGDQRRDALDVLEGMDSPKSMAALRDYEKNGKDQWVVNRVRTYFMSRPAVERGPDCR